MAYNTGNPIGSIDPRDAADNKENFDRFALSTSPTYTDRLGVERKTVTGTLQDYAAHNLRGEWTTATAYNVNDIWRDGPTGAFYLVLADYTSGASSAADIAGGNVVVHQPKDWVVSVDTIADLRALEPAFEWQQVELLGHTIAGIGGGMFYADYSSSAADDNGVTVVTAGGKRWRRVIIADVTVQMFGAVGDGAEDDTSAIQAAIDYIESIGGGVVLAPAGVYIIDMLNEPSPADFGGILIKNGVHLKGVGENTILKGKTIAGTSNFVYVANFADAENAKISDLKIDANKPSGETDEKQWHGIRWDGDTDKCSVDNLTIINGKGDGIWIVKNPSYGVVPKRGRINNCRFSGFNRQDIALIEGDGFTITNCSGAGVLDIEADSPSGKVNQNHFVENNSFDKIRISPLTGLSGVKTNIIAENNRCNELSTWGGNGDQLINNVVKGPIVFSQCGTVTFRGGSCYYIDQNVTNLTSVERLIIDDVIVESDSALVGIDLKDVVSAQIKPNITLTANGSIGINHANNSTQVAGTIEISHGAISSDSHCIKISAVGLSNTTHKITNTELISASGRSISKDGASASGCLEFAHNAVHSQPVIRMCTSLIMRGNQYYDVANVNTDSNSADSIVIDGERFFGSVPTWAISSNTVSGQIVMRDIAGSNVTIGASKFSFTSTTAAGVLFDNIISNSDAPYFGLTATIRSGSIIRIVDSTVKYARWYNGTSWVDIS